MKWGCKERKVGAGWGPKCLHGIESPSSSWSDLWCPRCPCALSALWRTLSHGCLDAVSQFPVVLFDKFYYLTSWSYYLPVVLDWVCSHVKAETCDSQSAACLSPWCRVARTPPQWCEEVFLSCIVWWAPKTTGTAGAMRVGVQKPENMAFWSLSTVANAQLLVTVCEA